MNRSGIPKLSLAIIGDWSAVVRAAHKTPYWDELLGQKPDTAEDAENISDYKVSCKDTQELVAAYNTFAASKSLALAFAFNFKSDDGSVSAWAQTDNCYTRAGGPECIVTIHKDDHALVQAIEKAVSILNAACE